MTIKELKKFIKDIPDDTVVLLSSDGEGNDFHGLYFVDEPTGAFAEFDIKQAVVLWPDDDSMEPTIEDDENGDDEDDLA